MPVGPMPRELLEDYVRLIQRFRTPSLSAVQSFCKSRSDDVAQFRDWGSGMLHLRFMLVRIRYRCHNVIMDVNFWVDACGQYWLVVCDPSLPILSPTRPFARAAWWSCIPIVRSSPSWASCIARRSRRRAWPPLTTSSTTTPAVRGSPRRGSRGALLLIRARATSCRTARRVLARRASSCSLPVRRICGLCFLMNHKLLYDPCIDLV